ncbi:MAG: sodium:solute symporter family protein [Bacteriovoracaceae bacterium]|nr:sodium:solute symporter family protein [Bacteriovoracaceae bacterium]
MNFEIFGIAVYVLIMLYVGYVVSKKIKSDDDYFLAGRSLGPVLGTFSIFATWFGAESCIGTSGKVFRNGLSGTHADPFGYTICIMLMAMFFARVLWNKQITTLPDLFRKRFSPTAEKMAAIIMIPSSIVWAGAQIRAFGQIIHVTTDYSVALAVTVAAVVVIIYTMFGGLLADAYNDLIQGIAIIIGLFILMIVMINDVGGVSAAIAAVKVEHLEFLKLEEGSWLSRWETWLVPILGSLMSQELVSRVSASKSASVAVNSAWRAAGIYMLIGIAPITVGLLGHVYHPNILETDSIMPMLAKTHLPIFLYILFIGALVAAILSTVDSTLLAVSALITHNLVYPFYPNLPEKRKVFLARSFVMLSGICAYAMTFSSESVTDMVETASSLGGPTILVMVCFALFSQWGNHINAIVAMCTSVIVWFFSHFVFEAEAPVIYTVVSCLVSYLILVPFTGTKKKGASLKPAP